MQISFVMLIFLLFSVQISGGGKVSERGQTASGGGPCGRKPASGKIVFESLPSFYSYPKLFLHGDNTDLMS